MDISVRVLDNRLSMNYITKLMGETQSIKLGLLSQYFVAHSIIEDFDAKISHGKGGPDIILSNPSLLDKLFNNTENEQKSVTDLEIKSFAWNYRSFSSAINSYKSRQQTQSFFIGISPVLLFKILESITFNTLEKGLLSVVVIGMEAVNSPTKELWKKVNDLANEQIPEDQDIKQIPLDKILEVLNFQRLNSLDDFNVDQKKFNVDQKKFNVDQKKFNVEITDKLDNFIVDQKNFNEDQKEFNEEITDKLDKFKEEIGNKLDVLIDMNKETKE